MTGRFQTGRPWLGRGLEHAAQVAVRDALGLTDHERVLVVTHPDPEVSRVALAVHDAAAAAGAEPVLVATQPRSGAQLADPVLLRALETDPQVLVLLTKGRIGGDPDRLARPIHSTYTHYLQYLVQEAPTRGFWASGVTRSAFARGVPVDPEALRREATTVAARLEEAVELRIGTGRGVELVVPVDGAGTRRETGDYREPGAMGELPSGEVVVPAVAGAAAGRLRVTGGLGLPEEAVASQEPVEVSFEAGGVCEVKGDASARSLEAAMADAHRLTEAAVREGWLTRAEAERYREGTRQVREVAFGLNPGLRPRGDPVADAKARGVVRVVLGAGLREFPPGAPVSLELVVPAASVSLVGQDGTESPLVAGGRLRSQTVQSAGSITR